MTKRLFALLLSLVLVFALFGCTEATPETQPPTEAPTEPPATEQNQTGATPLLYKVTDSDGDAVWLFGSIHVGTPDYYPLPDYVMDAFLGSDALAVEFDLVAYESDMEAQMQDLIPFIYTDQTTIADHMPAQLYADAVAIMQENGLYNPMLDMYSPVMWYSFLENCILAQAQLDTAYGVDRYMINAAMEQGVEILEVESSNFQSALLAGFPEELQVFLVQQMVTGYRDELAETVAANEQMARAWMQGDVQALTELLEEEIDESQYTEAELQMIEQFNNALVYERNITMTDFAKNALEAGKEVFICVGAAHIVGEGAMAQLLEQAGYTVERITA